MTTIDFPGRQYHLKIDGDDPPFHPIANLFPLLEGEDIRALKDDIARNGLLEPIVVLEGKILDGRNRYLACHGVMKEKGWPEITVECPTRFIEHDGSDPLTFVISKNLRRRHLNESQRAMVAARVATFQRGDNQHSPIGGTSQAQAADLLNVGKRSVERAREVIERGGLELIRAVDRGRMAVSVAADLATASENVQRQAVAEPERAHILVKQSLRAERERELATKILALPARRYGVLYADPPWRFEPYSRDTGMDRAADNHYPTARIEDIMALDVPSIAADDCILFLWATAPMLCAALAVMEYWQFFYKTHAVWIKDRSGTGYWYRNKHELLLLGTRGNPPAPAPGTQAGSIFEAAVGAHSEKPEIVYQMIEGYFPQLPKIELYARTRRAGWDAWGLEAPKGGEK